MTGEWSREPFLISTDPERIDLDVVHSFLTTAYWATGISREVVRRALEHSIVFGLYHTEQQIGMARVITDYTTFAYISDVFVLPAYRGRGLAGWLMETVTSAPELQGLRRWLLATRDAHGLYAKVGFVPLKNPERFMEINVPDVYLVQRAGAQQNTGTNSGREP